MKKQKIPVIAFLVLVLFNHGAGCIPTLAGQQKGEFRSAIRLALNDNKNSFLQKQLALLSDRTIPEKEAAFDEFEREISKLDNLKVNRLQVAVNAMDIENANPLTKEPYLRAMLALKIRTCGSKSIEVLMMRSQLCKIYKQLGQEENAERFAIKSAHKHVMPEIIDR